MALNDIQRLILKALAETTKKETLDDIKDIAVEQVKKRTRLGKGVSKPEGPAFRLKKLEKNTKSNRRNLKRKGKLSSQTTPAKSNLTRSGQMIDSVKGKSKPAQNKVEIRLDAEGEKKAARVQKIDPNKFTFMNLSKGETKQIVEFIEDKIQRLDKRLK